jgi:hypothetical protein
MDDKLNPSMAGFAWSYAINSILSGILVILKATSAGFKAFVTSILGHHWATHGAFILVLFLLLGFIFSAMKLGANVKPATLTWTMVLATVAGALIIIVFGLTEISY